MDQYPWNLTIFSNSLIRVTRRVEKTKILSKRIKYSSYDKERSIFWRSTRLSLGFSKNGGKSRIEWFLYLQTWKNFVQSVYHPPNFRHYFTLLSECFSTFAQATCLLSVSFRYLVLEVYTLPSSHKFVNLCYSFFHVLQDRYYFKPHEDF